MIRYLLAAVLALTFLFMAASISEPAAPEAPVEIAQTEAERIMCDQITHALGCTQSQANDILVGLRALNITEISDLTVEYREDGYIRLKFISDGQQYTTELSSSLKFDRITDAEGNDLFVMLY